MRFGGLIAAIVFAAIAAIVVLRMSSQQPAPVAAAPSSPPPVNAVEIYVASQPIPVGATLSEDMVAVQPWPEHLLLNGFMRAGGGGGGIPGVQGTRTNPVGMVARAPFQAQEPLLSTKLANPDDPNFLAGTLPKGMRVITIRTNEIEGLAGFIFPGDHVDVLLTHDVDKWVTPPNSGPTALPRRETDTVTETLLTNVLVLAVDQRADSANATDDKGKLVIPRSVSLMVSPADAQRVRLAAAKGTLTLALRALADKESSDPLTVTGAADISQYPGGGAATAEEGGNNGVLVVRGTSAEESPSGTGAAAGLENALPVAGTVPLPITPTPTPPVAP